MTISLKHRLHGSAIIIAALALFASFSAVSAQDNYDGEDGSEYVPQYEQYTPPPVEEPSPAAPPAPSTAVSAAADGASGLPDDDGTASASGGSGKSDGKGDAKPAGSGGSTPLFGKPGFELSVGTATIDGEPWSRIALGIDLPIWKFGVFLDLEFFIDNENQLSKKGWDFSKGNTAESIYRKIRYIRYGEEDEPLFVKFGGLSDVTLGYGMIVDRFTNMLRYPDEKLLGLQFYLNNVSPLGVTLQTLVSDFAEAGDEGGLYAARLAVRPFKPSGVFLADKLALGVMFAMDANVQAPARKWGNDSRDDILLDMYEKYAGTDYLDEYKEIYWNRTGQNADAVVDRINAEDALKGGKRSFSLYGFDVGLPIIETSLLKLDLYGQSAFRADTVSGWGIGAPGVAVKLWKLAGSVEYRMLGGRFTPGYFDTYYLDERFSRGRLLSKDEMLDSVSLSGVFGRLGMDVFGVTTIEGSYQYMAGEEEHHKRQSYELTAGLGDAIMGRIPKFDKAEVYIRNANIGMYDKYDKKGNLIITSDADVYPPETEKAGFFDRSPGMYWGYRLGFEIANAALLVWDYRYGWKEKNGKLVSDNHMIIQTSLKF